ncbi:aspartate/glutamate racemase family protein [Desulforhopalus singaporensis]|uniref:Allantoin racemase n=1 Tax=Desulforhopalus singaporensis TaxID=91360 RepID=A0A1H0SJQ9_9BACT|nr:aspartate/glutamate racemase family protein [Desulforhopalus singaporensis]SDP41950.1 allantoin racemase [Desulforhopalus singaporensis]
MKICVINPNTSSGMTSHIREELVKVKSPATELKVVCPARGPETIECAVDEAYAVPEMLKLVAGAQQDGFDAVVIACFSDPGLDGAKELATIPVIGIGEASIHAAAMLGAKFTVITPVKRRVPTRIRQALDLVCQHRLASVRSLDLSVAQSESDSDLTINTLLDVVGSAVEEDGAEVIVLGCAGMTGYTEQIEKQYGVVVIDPCTVALKFAESFVALRLGQSKTGHFAMPPAKLYRV